MCDNGHDLFGVLSHKLCALSGVSTFSLAISSPNFFEELSNTSMRLSPVISTVVLVLRDTKTTKSQSPGPGDTHT